MILFLILRVSKIIVVFAVIIAVAAITILSVTFFPLTRTGSTVNSTINLQPQGTQIASNASSENQSSTDWLMYHRDLEHTGSVQSNLKTSIKQDWLSTALDGAIYAEPLVEGNSVFVVTENNSIYSLNAQNGSVNWKLHVGSPVPGQSLPCGDIDPSGITGTPVIDKPNRTLYTVIFLNSSPARHYLVSVNIDSGKGLRTIPIDPAGADPSVQQQRAALGISNGTVYVPFGGLFGDCGNYHGYVVGSRNGTLPIFDYKVPSVNEAGFWASSGPVFDKAGNLYITSGNGASSTVFDHGNTLLKLSSSLNELGYFSPSNWAELNSGDTDLGSTGPAIVGPNLLFQIGKDGIGYLVNASSPKGIGGQIFSGQVCNAAFGGTAFSSPILFVPCTDGLYALKVSQTSFSVIWHSTKYFAGPPIVTAGLVWTVDSRSATLHAYRASDGHEIFNYNLGNVPHFVTPSAMGDKRIFVVSSDNKIESFAIS